MQRRVGPELGRRRGRRSRGQHRTGDDVAPVSGRSKPATAARIRSTMSGAAASPDRTADDVHDGGEHVRRARDRAAAFRGCCPMTGAGAGVVMNLTNPAPAGNGLAVVRATGTRRPGVSSIDDRAGCSVGDTVFSGSTPTARPGLLARRHRRGHGHRRLLRMGRGPRSTRPGRLHDPRPTRSARNRDG